MAGDMVVDMEVDNVADMLMDMEVHITTISMPLVPLILKHLFHF